MNFPEIVAALGESFRVVPVETKPDPHLKVESSELPALVTFLKQHLHFETLSSISGVDQPAADSLQVVYHLFSYHHRCGLALKVTLARNAPTPVPSIHSIFRAANWLEREVYDLFGIEFAGHPDLRRILMPEDWTGFPLRKDYETPDYYAGMPVPLYFDEPKGLPN